MELCKTQKKGSIVPIPVKIQRSEETLDEAIQYLANACQKNRYPKKVLIKTHSQQNQPLFEVLAQSNIPDLIVIDDIKDLSKIEENLVVS